MEARGDFIGGKFLPPEGEPFRSRNPARDGETVLETAGSPARVRLACEAAREALSAWARLSFAERLEHLHRFRDALKARADSLAEAISLEMGKIRSEARVEIDGVVARFASVEAQVKADLREGPVPGFPQEVLRYHAHGVVGVIGPFNFPIHLCHVHVVPALLLGNTVVVKPSEVTPLSGERYAEAAQAAGLPPGVLNVVHGRGDVGAALAKDPALRALAFTGSWATGRRIAESLLDRPEVLLALEMGGKNACVVREDADLRSAVHEIVTSGYLTTGQRCTCADRLLVHRSRADELVAALDRVLGALRFGDPEDPASFAGPLASEGARERFLAAMKRAEEGGAEVVRAARPLDGGFYVTPSIHRVRGPIPGYTDIEIFGPDLCVEVFDDDDEAIAKLNDSEYGFAHSIFTNDERAFERYFAEVEAGIINKNRSTNQASPRLPFGGIKHSGNFRPAGAWAHRNLVYPVAHIRNEGGAFARHPKITPHLPTVDLDRLEEAHAREEREEAARSLLETPRVLSPSLPAGGALPRSSAVLERFYAGDRYVREKKPPVFDHLRSSGPWFVSIDDEPLAVIDGMSQTATIPAGFAPDRVVRAYVEGELGEAPVASADITLGGVPEAERFAAKLRELVPGLPTVCFAGSGAEANEKAYALCRAHAKDPGKATKLLAFEGSFHGRTLLALFASYNPSKRVPFQIAGYEVDFAPFPVWASPGVEPEEPPGFAELCAKADIAGLEARFGASEDPLLRAEVASLAYVGRALATGTYFAVDIEPMQSEGGDRYATARFFRGLRLLTRALGVPLIMDEVQTGFGLGGTFLWHQRFGLRTADGAPDTPDCVVFAKRAQVGVCMSVFPDPEPTSAFPASLARGLLHAELVDGRDAARVEALVEPRLAELSRRWGHRIENPRATGYALAFELKDTAEMNAYLEQRFWRGAIVFGAGTRTIRYRLNSSFDERTIDLLFESMHRSLAWLEAHPGKKPPAWEDFPAPPKRPEPPSKVRIRVADPSEADRLMPRILEIEAAAYEPARRDDEAHLRKAFAKDGVAVVAETEDGRVVGSALGTPLENVADVEGCDRDPMLGRENTLYSMAVTVDPAYQGHGIGRKLKLALLEQAARMKRADGSPRYLHASGRNRLPEAGAMSRLNDQLGAYTVFMLEGQYGGEGVARYYRQPLGPFVPAVNLRGTNDRDETTDLASGLARPFASPPETLVDLYEKGGLFGPSVHKITVLNYITPAVARATEWLAALTPNHPHAYLCSSRDEATDKSVRILRWHRKDAQIVIGLEGGYVGHTTACARSISDPAVHRQGPAHFAWPRVPHPADGIDASIAALRATIERAGRERVLGIYLEAVQERTGRVIPDAYWSELAKLRADTGVPIVLVETASAYYRSGAGPFASSAIEGFVPDLVIWWTGGQLGLVHVTSPYHVPNPLTLVSTWDGDELSLVQVHHQLRAARRIDVEAGSKALDEALSGLDLPVFGRGLYRVIHAGDRAEALVKKLAEHGIRVRAYPGGRLALAPFLDRAVEHAERLARALRP